MDPVDECPDCHGMGRVRMDLPPDHPDFGKLQPCPNPMHQPDWAARQAAMCGLKPHERDITLDSIVALNEVTAQLASVVRQFVQEPRGWLYVWGGPGNGKSLALMAAVNDFVNRGAPALYITFADLLAVLRETFQPPAQPRSADVGEDAWRRWDTFQNRFRRIQAVKLLAVDEFDARKVNQTGFVTELRTRLIDHRYRDATAGQTFTMFAGNEDPAQLPPWICDRVRDGRFVIFHNEAPSVRPMMQW